MVQDWNLYPFCRLQQRYYYLFIWPLRSRQSIGKGKHDFFSKASTAPSSNCSAQQPSKPSMKISTVCNLSSTRALLKPPLYNQASIQGNAPSFAFLLRRPFDARARLRMELLLAAPLIPNGC